MPGRKPYAHSFLSERRTSGVMPDRKPYAQSFLSERNTSGVTQSRKLFPLKKSPVPKHGGIFLFHLIVIVLIQASCEVEEGRGVGGVD